MNVPQDDLAAPRAAIQELERRKRIVRASHSVDRARQLIETSRALIATERKLMAQWRERREDVLALLSRATRSPRKRLFIAPKPLARVNEPAAAPALPLPKAA